MIRPRTPPDTGSVARHYDELDPFYRTLWGEHLHHGLWLTGRETARAAAVALVDEVARRARVGPGTRVCDVGYGYGAAARLLAARGAEVTALSISEAQLRHAAALGAPARVRFLRRDWLESGLPDGSADAVVAIESLAHMDGPRALAEARRVLRPGGRLVACVWLAAPSPRPWQVRHLLRPICEEGRLAGLADAAEYRRWAQEAGLAGVAVEDVSDRVARTWTVSARNVARGLLEPAAIRYLLDARNSERRFAFTVLRMLAAYRTGAFRYGILTATRPGASG